jgi:hypothetical protein
MKGFYGLVFRQNKFTDNKNHLVGVLNGENSENTQHQISDDLLLKPDLIHSCKKKSPGKPGDTYKLDF